MAIFNHVVVKVEIGYIVVDEITDNPLVDPNGHTVLYFRKVDAERAIEDQKAFFERCDRLGIPMFENAQRPKAPDIPPARHYKWSWRNR